MRKLLYVAIILCISNLSCSKKNNDSQSPLQVNSVSIEGSNYSTVVLGNQTWTAVNYNGPGGKDYNNGANNVAYGKLYTEEEAQTIILPVGWRLPTVQDFFNLIPLTGAVKLSSGNYNISNSQVLTLMSKTGWNLTNGTDSLGFNAVPAGFYSSSYFNGLGIEAIFITSTISPPGSVSPLTFYISPGIANVSEMFGSSTTQGASIRFVKDN